MTHRAAHVVGLTALLLASAACPAADKVVAEHNGPTQASADFKFKAVPSPSKTDAGSRATFTVVSGRPDPNGPGLAVLTDGRLPGGADEPDACFFFAAGTPGGRLRADLGAVAEVRQVNTYSWHATTRGPQVYTLYAADGSAAGFDPAPKAGIDPAKAGWTLVAAVDTRPKDGSAGGGQHGTSVADAAGPLGRYRYLLLDVARTEDRDPFGNTFFGEIDIVTDKEVPADAVADGPATKPIVVAAGAYEITIDVANASPAVRAWAEAKLKPVCAAWYPKLVELLPSDGFEAPKRVTIVFQPDLQVPAYAAGGKITCNAKWFARNLDGEAAGCVVHEMVHIVQQYRRVPGGRRNPGWLVEGLADYVRWFLYEPESKGAEIRDPARAKHDASYRVTANFLNFVAGRYDKDVARKLNAAMRQGKYDEAVWKELTGKTVEELAAEWKAGIGKQGG